MTDAAKGLERWLTSGDGLNLFYRDYGAGNGERPALLCLPGLTRNSRDFADFAARYRDRHRVICPDLRGRGRSDRDPSPMNYQIPTYLGDLGQLMVEAETGPVIVVGTSLGGILGMLLAASAPGAVAGLIFNDVGPEVDQRGLDRIAGYVGVGEPPADWPAAIAAIRAIGEDAYPGMEDEFWQDQAERIFDPDPDGGLRAAYDPGIGETMRAAQAAQAAGEVPAPDLWPVFSAVAALPILVVRGALSDILSPETVARMAEIKPDLSAVEVEGRGHVPLLDEPESLAAIDAFLARF